MLGVSTNVDNIGSTYGQATSHTSSYTRYDRSCPTLRALLSPTPLCVKLVGATFGENYCKGVMRRSAVLWHEASHASHRMPSHHVTSRHITSHHITSRHIPTNRTTPHCTTTRHCNHITSHHFRAHRITSHRITLHHTALHYIVSHHTARRHATPRRTVQHNPTPPTVPGS